jgi:hypothetical protein
VASPGLVSGGQGPARGAIFLSDSTGVVELWFPEVIVTDGPERIFEEQGDVLCRVSIRTRL